VDVAAIDVGVLTTGHDVADARLHKIVRALHERGLTVEVRGLGEQSDGPEGARVIAGRRRGLFRRGLSAVALPWQSRARVLLTLDPDAIPSARLSGILRRRRVVVDVHEDYAKLLADRSWSKGFKAVAAGSVVRLATRLAGHADLTVVADDHLPPRTARQRLVVPNVPSETLMPAATGRDLLPRAVYVGDVRESRGLFDMIEAIAAAPDWQLDVVGPVAVRDRSRLRDRLAMPDVTGRIRLHDRRPPKESWLIARGAWTGLCLLHDTPAFRDALPTKLHEYMACGLALLVSDLPRQARVVHESGAGVVVGSVDEATEVLRAWASDPSLVDALQAAARARARANSDARDPYATLADVIAGLAGVP
jgi:glycosyltransferase involved in cell wall biosynthesis